MITNPFQLFTERLHTKHESNTLLLVAVALGLATGLGVWIFRLGIEWFNELFIKLLANEVLSPVIGALAIIVSLTIAGAIVGALMDRFVGEERHHGVAGIIESVALAGGRLPYVKIPFKALASALSLGAGASVGPEDPSVQIGANLGSWFGQRLELDEERVRLLVAAGGASAIAAAFKAPIAGVFFALEVVLNGEFETRSFGVVVLASVLSSAFTQAVTPAAEMGPFNYALGNPLEIALFFPLGIILALVSVAFVRLVYWQHDYWHHHVHWPRPVRTAFAGALVGIVAIFLPQIMGAGRETMNAILSGESNFTLFMLLALAVAKMAMTSVSMAGGFVGGIFAPALFVGTVAGSLYGQIIERLFGNALGNSQVYAIAGMAAVMAGVVRSPITSIMIVFELTNDYRLILPIMMATVVCVFASERLMPYGIYVMGLVRKGVHLTPGRETDLMQGITVAEAMLKSPPVIYEDASLVELRDALRAYRSNSLCVLDHDDLLAGVITLSDLQRAYQTQTSSEKPLTVGDICSRHPATVSPDDDMWMAIRIMSAHDVGRLPVVKPGTRQLVGFIGRHGVMRAYQMAISRKSHDHRLAQRIRLNTLAGGQVFEFRIGPETTIAGQHISDIHWPSESVIASIMRGGKLLIPHGKTEIKTGDLVTIVADPDVHDELLRLIGATELQLATEE
ncbi:MAG: chloride channel protein [Anaerolineae bacterium]